MSAVQGMLGRLLQQLAGELNITPEKLRSLILAGDEALTPNYLQTDAAGNVQLAFPGGVILPSDGGGGPFQNAPTVNSITWENSSTGALVAQINADDSFNAGEAYFKTQDAAANNIAILEETIGGLNTRVAARAISGSSDSEKVIIRANGHSAFMQPNNEINMKCWFGICDLNGAYSQGSGFISGTHLGVGRYHEVVSIGSGASIAFAVVNMFSPAVEPSAWVYAVTSDSFDVAINNIAIGSGVDAAFFYMFIQIFA